MTTFKDNKVAGGISRKEPLNILKGKAKSL